MEGDFTIAKMAWLSKRKGNEDRRDEITRQFAVFVHFLQTNGLTVRRLLGPGETPNDEFTIRRSDLTEEGFNVVKQGYDKWLTKVIDKGKDPADVTILERALQEVRKERSL
jgi:hypothetical protein